MNVKTPIKLDIKLEELDKDNNIKKEIILKDEDIKFFCIKKEDTKDGICEGSNK
jgi:hypothetical protein